MLFFHRNIVCFRPVKEDMVTITITCFVLVTLAIILLSVLIYLWRKKRKTFCKKHFRKGNSYLKLHCPSFQYQMIFIQTNYLRQLWTFALIFTSRINLFSKFKIFKVDKSLLTHIEQTKLHHGNVYKKIYSTRMLCYDC